MLLPNLSTMTQRVDFLLESSIFKDMLSGRISGGQRLFPGFLTTSSNQHQFSKVFKAPGNLVLAERILPLPQIVRNALIDLYFSGSQPLSRKKEAKESTPARSNTNLSPLNPIHPVLSNYSSSRHCRRYPNQ